MTSAPTLMPPISPGIARSHSRGRRRRNQRFSSATPPAAVRHKPNKIFVMAQTGDDQKAKRVKKANTPSVIVRSTRSSSAAPPAAVRHKPNKIFVMAQTGDDQKAKRVKKANTPS